MGEGPKEELVDPPDPLSPLLFSNLFFRFAIFEAREGPPDLFKDELRPGAFVVVCGLGPLPLTGTLGMLSVLLPTGDLVTGDLKGFALLGVVEGGVAMAAVETRSHI